MIFKRKNLFRLALIDLIWIIIFIIISIMANVSIRAVIQANETEGAMIIERSVRRAAVSCYALEGRYPENLNYLLDNYNIIIDKDRYLVHYSAIGSNLMPDITVLRKNTK